MNGLQKQASEKLNKLGLADVERKIAEIIRHLNQEEKDDRYCDRHNDDSPFKEVLTCEKCLW